MEPLPLSRSSIGSPVETFSTGWAEYHAEISGRAWFLLIVSCFIIANQYLNYRRIAKLGHCETICRRAPVKDPFIGLDFVYERFLRGIPGKNLHQSHKTFKELGSTYMVSRWASKAIHTCDSENIKHMLAAGFKIFKLPQVRVSVMMGLLGAGIFTLEGGSWSHARGILRTALTRQKMDRLPTILERHTQALFTRLGAGTSSVDLQPLFFYFTMDVATEFLMGRSTHMLNNDTRAERDNQFANDYMLCSEEATMRMRLGPLSRFRYNTAAEKAKRRVFKYVDEYIEDSLQSHNQDGDNTESTFIKELADAISDRKVLRDQVFHILLASRDTTASLLSNLFFVLAKQPATYAKLRDEIVGAIGEAVPTFEELKDLRYLRWCVNESLRLHPVISSNAREATHDTTLPRGGGLDGKSPLLVPKGTVVLFSIYSLHRDTAVFGNDVEEFVPERWDRLRPGWNYLPFIGGPRVCLGQQFALLETYYVIVRLVQKFATLESLDQRAWIELSALATTCQNGVHVKMGT